MIVEQKNDISANRSQVQNKRTAFSVFRILDNFFLQHNIHPFLPFSALPSYYSVFRSASQKVKQNFVTSLTVQFNFYILFGQSVLVSVCFIINIIHNYFQLRLSVSHGSSTLSNSPRSSALILTSQYITASSLFSDSQ